MRSRHYLMCLLLAALAGVASMLDAPTISIVKVFVLLCVDAVCYSMKEQHYD